MVQHDISTNSLRQFEHKNSFRQVCDKPCANRIICAEWSPQRDLIAVITNNGEVRLHRMYWQKVWLLPAKEAHATCLAWKYNGRLLAIGYDNGDVQLVEIEKSVVVHSMHCNSRITSLCWIAKKKKAQDIIYEDCCEKWLPELIKEELKKELQYNSLNIGDDDQYSILVVGNDQGEINLFIEGVYSALHLSLKNQLDLASSSILSLHLSLDTGIISVICKGQLNNITCDEEINDSITSKDSYYFHQFKSELLSSRGPELSHLSAKFIKMKNTIEFCGILLKQMSDASEDVCLKINSKLEKLEQSLRSVDRTVANEFIITYATGKISPELTKFLTQNLTAKGLKQIAQNVQSAYLNLRSDVGELDTLIQHVLSHIVELQGMVSWHEKFGVLGLVPNDIQECIILISQFRLKTQEIHDVIANDMKNFSVFFSWLKNILCQAGGDFSQVAPFQLSNDDYDIMLEFLEFRLLKIEKESGSSYDMEQVSQYFKEGCSSKLKTTQNPWYEYVKSNDILNSSDMIIKPAENETLQELYVRLKIHYNVIFDSVSISLSKSIQTVLSCNLYNHVDGHEDDCKSQFSFMQNEDRLLLLNLACTCDSDRMFLLDVDSNFRLSLTGLILSLVSAENSNVDLDQSFQCQYTLRDVKFYNQDFITVLAEEDDKPNDRLVTILGQVPLKPLLQPPSKPIVPDIINTALEDDTGVNWMNLISKFSELRRMEAFRGKQLNVNGHSRKVSSIVSMSGRRIRIFDMTAEDDEIDDSKMEDSKLDNTSSISGKQPSIIKSDESSGEEEENSLKIEKKLNKVNISINDESITS